MNQIADAYAAGMTTKQIVNVYTTKPQFTSVYPNFYTNAQFANALIENVVGTSASAAAKAQAKADVEAALNIGWSRGDVIYQIFTNLANKPLTDPDWGNTAKLLANQVAVARYYTEVKLGNTTDLATLKAVIANVTPTTDVSTPAALDAVLAGVATGQTFTLTTGTDYADTTTAFLNGGSVTSTFKFTSGNETVNAAGGTFSNVDILVDGSTTDNDVLNATLTGSAPIAANLTNIETLKLNLAGNGTGLDFAAITGAKTVEISGTQNGVLSNVAATAPEVTLTGGYDKTLTVAFDTLAGTSSSNPETLKVNLNGAGSKAAVQINIEGTSNNGSLEELTINSAGTAANTLTVGTADFDTGTGYASANGISKFTVTGSQDLTLKVDHATISTKTLANSGTGKLTLDVDRGTATAAVTSLAQATGYQTLVLRGTGDVNVSGIANGATVQIVDSFTGTNSDSLSVKGAASGTNDSLTLVLDHKTDATNLTFSAAFAVNDIETVNIQSKGGDSTGHTLGDTSTGFEANAAKTINISGDTKLTLNLDTDTKFETLNIEGAAKHSVDFVGTGAVTYASGKNVTVSAGTATGDLTLDLSQVQLDTGTSTTETLSVTTGSGKDTLTFGSTLAGAKLVVDAGAGDNTIVVKGDGTAATNNISGEVSITTGSGKDTIVFGPSSTAANSDLESSSAKVTIATGAGDDVVKLGNVTAAGKGSTVDLGDGADKVYVGISGAGTATAITNEITITTGAGSDTVYLYKPDNVTGTGQAQKIVITDFTAGTGGDVLNLNGWVGATGFATSFASANSNGQAALTQTAAENGLFKLGAFDQAKIANGTAADVAFNIDDQDSAIAVLFNNNTGLTEVWIAYDSDASTGSSNVNVVVEKIATLENVTLTGIADLKIENFSFA
ncbi:beta strand repeat-containing protein [Tepidimonas sp. HKU79]|uniref:beta strand repeat-containing protein n=1 Tax=Tepidimonas sp. HKU79 TaxID=3414505 RepID=UPI003C7AFF9A